MKALLTASAAVLYASGARAMYTTSGGAFMAPPKQFGLAGPGVGANENFNIFHPEALPIWDRPAAAASAQGEMGPAQQVNARENTDMSSSGTIDAKSRNDASPSREKEGVLEKKFSSFMERHSTGKRLRGQKLVATGDAQSATSPPSPVTAAGSEAGAGNGAQPSATTNAPSRSQQPPAQAVPHSAPPSVPTPQLLIPAGSNTLNVNGPLVNNGNGLGPANGAGVTPFHVTHGVPMVGQATTLLNANAGAIPPASPAMPVPKVD